MYYYFLFVYHECFYVCRYIRYYCISAENTQLAGSIGSTSIDTQNETNTQPLPHSITNVTDLNTITSDTSPPSPLESHINNTQQQQEQTADPHAIIDMSVDTVDMRNDR